MKTLITGVLLFSLFTGFNEYSFLPQPAHKILHDTLSTFVTKPNFQLNFIPDITVQLMTGEHIQLQQLIDQEKYIFINVWSAKRRISIKNAEAVDSLAEVYKNKLAVIGLLDEGNLVQLKRLIKKHQLKNVQGLVSADIKKYLQVNVYPYGILFSKTGKLIEAGMDTKALAMYMGKHVVVNRAKF